MTTEQRAMLGDKEAAKRMTDAGVLLMQGDCLELLKDIPDGSVDMVLTDPHYIVTPRHEIRFVRGRLKFGGAKNSAPFPSMVVVFRPKMEMPEGME